ncbi:hypothetical protein J2X19_003816 [Rhodoferax ferrireducens]|uniref:Uncharacterized protein n=1 Tax=Rhodoferax ferrireducens TaxID=192843 RepID=A0ABU2CCQ6_9BURK|nr:hypothetical protein [Rhodoferax ferrireducens]MDR7379122.1 hypothetical protein [Rhodoferax ferrireducens]
MNPGKIARMPFLRHCLLPAVFLAFCGPLAWAADAPASKDMQIVQRIDDVLVGVDAVSLEILGRRHVAGTYFLINLRRPSPVAGYADFVADCQGPLRIATLSSTLPSGSLQPEPPPLLPRRATALDLESLSFNPVHMLDGTWLVAEFACRSSSQPGAARHIARQLREKGGPPDMLSVYCDLQADGSNETRRGVEVRFSEQDDAVAVNHQWLSSGFVSDTEVVFGSGAQWVVDRQARRARLLGGSGALLFEGKCDSRAP